MHCRCCNNDRFYAHQVLRADVIVNSEGYWEDNASCTLEKSIYDSEKPYGPFTCTRCRAEYNSLGDQMPYNMVEQTNGEWVNVNTGKVYSPLEWMLVTHDNKSFDICIMDGPDTNEKMQAAMEIYVTARLTFLGIAGNEKDAELMYTKAKKEDNIDHDGCVLHVSGNYARITYGDYVECIQVIKEKD